MKKILLLIISAIVVLNLGACANTKLYDKSKADIQASQQQAVGTQKKAFTKVRNETGFYADTKAFVVKRPTPHWARAQVKLVGQGSFASLVNRLLIGTNQVASYAPGIDKSRPVNVHFSGTIMQALKVLSAKTGYFFTTRDDIVSWSPLEVKTFQIAFMPGNIDYHVGTTTQSFRSANEVSGGDASSNHSGSNGGKDKEFSTFAGKLSVWKDMDNSIKKLLSKNGSVIVSQSTSSITVKDHPSNIDAVAQYVEQTNKNLSQQVAIKVQVIDVDLNHEHERGIDWAAINKAFSVTVGSGLGDLLKITGKEASTASLIGTINRGHWNGSQLLIRALEQQGGVSVKTEPTAVTLNNQVAQIELTKSTGYLKEQEVTVTPGTTTITQNSLVPGTVTEGMKLYLLPRIMGSNVYLQISTTLSQLLGFRSLSGGGSTSIQVPTVTTKHFNQRSEVRSGSTLVLAGFKQKKRETKKASYFEISPLGGNNALSGNIETVVLITPTIVKQQAF